MERVYLFPGEYDIYFYRPVMGLRFREPVLELNFADLYPTIMTHTPQEPNPTQPSKIKQD
jgi:hypothetical protein